jgi:hypothetical protein
VANVLTNVMPKLLAQGLVTLRQNAIMPRLINRRYEAMAGQRGSTVDVPIPSAITVRDVTAAVTMPANQDFSPGLVQIQLNKWKEAPFQMSDKDILEAMSGTIPMQAAEAIKGLANQVDADILAEYKRVFNYVGTAGTTPFVSDVSNFTDAMVLMDTELSPTEERRVVLDPRAQGNALKLPEFLRADARGDQGGIIKGQIGEKIGSLWFMDQNVPTHTSTVLSVGAATVNGVHAVGAGSLFNDGFITGTVSIAKATNTSDLVAGDILTFAGDTQTYTVVTAVTLAVGNTAVTISPPLRTAKVGGEAVTLKASHKVNLHFHRDCFALASRPLLDVADGLGNLIQSAIDPVTGLVLRLEISRQYKQTTFSYDILYGTKCVRPQLGVRIAG